MLRSLGVVGVVASLLASPTMSAQSLAVGSTSVRPASSVKVTVTVMNERLEQVLRMIARQGDLQLVVSGGVIALDRPVSLDVRGVDLTVAFARALAGTGATAAVVGGRVLVKPAETGKAPVAQGGISGKVVDGKTRQGLRGATVTLAGTDKRTTSNDAGAFRVLDVVPGSYTVQVRMLGYVKMSKPVTVTEGQTVALDIVLEPSVNALDQVVVTGTVIPTELKAVPSAIIVITAQQIEERGITRIDQLFRGEVPGLFSLNVGSHRPLDEVIMFSRGATALSNQSVGTNGYNTNSIKTYIDGVEMADAQYLSQIDPQSIERIEIIAGPQASTIYGSNAINGVMQIFTKRGTSSRPQLTLNLMSGWVENNFSTAHAPQHDYSAHANGLEGRISYNAGGSWNYMAPWTPSKQMTRLNAFGGMRLDLPTSLGRLTADMTFRRAMTQGVSRGDAAQLTTLYRVTGLYAMNRFSPVGLSQPTTSTLAGQTLGLEFGYNPTPSWSHFLNIGQDGSAKERRYTQRGYLSPTDTTLLLSQESINRRSLRYTTTAQVALASSVQGTVTLGADTWQTLASTVSAKPQSLTGTLTGVTSVSRQPDHNTGGFLQAQLGMHDRLFLTYGLRAEWNPAFGKEAQPNFAPRYGVVFTEDVGVLTTKIRASYGRSTRPPAQTLRSAQTMAEFYSSQGSAAAIAIIYPLFGNFDYRLANPELSPEHQQGGEGGLEVYWGGRGSIVITRYNQTIDGLINTLVVDSIRSLVPTDLGASLDREGYSYFLQMQTLNTGSIRNQGWELQGSLVTGPLTTRGTYSWAKSRTIGVNPKYREQLADFPQYQPGATFQYLPEHTWSLGVTYAQARTTLGIDISGIGKLRNIQNDFYYRYLNGNQVRLLQNLWNYDAITRYVSVNPGYAQANLMGAYRFSSKTEGVLQVQNLTDHYQNDFQANYAVLGRQVKGGFRLRL